MKKIWITVGLVSLAALFIAVIVLRQQSSREDIVIGAVLPMTGDAAKYGKWIAQGAQQAVDEINQNNGVNGRHLRLAIQDSQTNPSAGTSAFQHLISADKPTAVLTTLTGVVRAIIPIADSKQVVLFANATLPGLTDGSEYVFRNVTNLSSDVPAMVEFAKDSLSMPRIAILWRNDEFGVWGSKEFSRLYTKAGGNIVASIPYEKDTDDFRSIVDKAANDSPDAVYALGYSEVGKIARQAKEQGHNWQFLGITTMGDPEAIKLAGGTLEGGIYTEPSFSLSSSDAAVTEFKEKYHNRYGEDPDVWAATFYDSVKLIVKALQGKEPTPQELRKGLLNIQGFPGVTGTTSFLPNGDVQKKVIFKQIRNGQPVSFLR